MKGDMGMSDVVCRTYEYMKEKQMGEGTGHDWWHTYRVYRMALQLADAQEEMVDREVVSLGALLHDIEDWKFHDGDEEAGPEAAEKWLRECGAGEALIVPILEIVRDLSYKGMDSKNLCSLEGKIVQDSDRLDAVGAIGIARCFAYGGAFGRELYNPLVPARRDITSEQYKSMDEKPPSVNHFYEKLFLLKDGYHTKEAQKIGLERHAYMKEYVKRLLEECQEEEMEQYRLLDTL